MYRQTSSEVHVGNQTQDSTVSVCHVVVQSGKAAAVVEALNAHLAGHADASAVIDSQNADQIILTATESVMKSAVELLNQNADVVGVQAAASGSVDNGGTEVGNSYIGAD